MTRSARPARRRSPSGPSGSALLIVRDAGFLSVVGLAILAVATLSLLGGSLPFGIGSGSGNGNGNGGPVRTPAPSNVVVVDPRTKVLGSIAYVKSGNIWVQSGAEAEQLTDGGHDSSPAWSPDGAWIYFIRTVEEGARYPSNGRKVWYTLTYPLLMRVASDGVAPAEELGSGRFTNNQGTWFYWLRQPTPDPLGGRLALVSDGPDPTKRNVILQLFDLATGELTKVDVPEKAPFGHQDPTWRPDGALLFYVQNDRDRARGAPSIHRFNPTTGRTAAVTGPGYLSPSFSPDGRFIAATRVTSFGTDIVVLDALNGAELLRVTTDERSFSPVWSPAGDGIAFLHVEHGIVDLRLVGLTGAGPDWTLADPLDLTEVSGLDAASRPVWFIPADQLPEPTPAPTPVPTPTPLPSPDPGSPTP